MSGVEHPQELPAGARDPAQREPEAPGAAEESDQSRKRRGVSIPAQRPGEAHVELQSVDGPPGRFDDPALDQQAESRTRMRRGVHATTATELLLSLPSFVFSLAVMIVAGQLVATITGAAVWAYVIVAGWLASGLLALWRPVENVVAVVVMRLRRPTLRENEVLESAWTAVTQAAGSRGSYRLWVEESETVNGSATTGHTIAVTRWALKLPPRQLEAILAHELGHHLAGHTWTGFLGYWYALPGWLAWKAAWFLLWLVLAILSHMGWLGSLLALAVVAGVVCAGLTAVTQFPPVLLLFALPFLQAFVMRRGELYADRVAARLGYGQPMLEVLYQFLEEGEDVARREARWRERLLASHPPVATRIRALERYLSQLES
ncbi:MAG TPA: M48 family metalloprotease [Natronosporangium sp.]|nr:M48 family metalloprotease [Natronosporangium sp.]